MSPEGPLMRARRANAIKEQEHLLGLHFPQGRSTNTSETPHWGWGCKMNLGSWLATWFFIMIVGNSYQYTVYVWVSILETLHNNCVLVLKWVQPGSGGPSPWVAKLILNGSSYLGNITVKMLGQIIGFKPQGCHLSRFSWIYLSRGGEPFSRTCFQSLSLWNWAVWELH